MHQDEVKALFDKQAAHYDTQWEKTASIRHCLHLLLGSLFAELPANARILCVGVGTGDELFYLASRNPGWRFTAVDPSGPMLDVCRKRAEKEGVASRCIFHEGYLGCNVKFCLKIGERCSGKTKISDKRTGLAFEFTWCK